MATRRGKKLSDVASTQRFSFVELQDVRVPVGLLTYLAILLFLSKHAEHRAEVFVIDRFRHGGCEEE